MHAPPMWTVATMRGLEIFRDYADKLERKGSGA